MTSISRNVYIDKLDDIVTERNNKYYSTIKLNRIDVKSRTYIDSGIEKIEKDLKFKVSDHVIISKYKNYFCIRLLSKLVWRSLYDQKS